MAAPSSTFPLQDHLGMTVDSPEPGVAVGRVAVTDELVNPNGVLHGAVVFALVDTSMGAATMSALDAGRFCASIEVQVRFLRPVAGGSIAARTTALHVGKRVAQLTSEVHDDEGRLVATASGSFAVL